MHPRGCWPTADISMAAGGLLYLAPEGRDARSPRLRPTRPQCQEGPGHPRFPRRMTVPARGGTCCGEMTDSQGPGRGRGRILLAPALAEVGLDRRHGATRVDSASATERAYTAAGNGTRGSPPRQPAETRPQGARTASRTRTAARHQVRIQRPAAPVRPATSTSPGRRWPPGQKTVKLPARSELARGRGAPRDSTPGAKEATSRTASRVSAPTNHRYGTRPQRMLTGHAPPRTTALDQGYGFATSSAVMTALTTVSTRTTTTARDVVREDSPAAPTVPAASRAASGPGPNNRTRGHPAPRRPLTGPTVPAGTAPGGQRPTSLGPGALPWPLRAAGRVLFTGKTGSGPPSALTWLIASASGGLVRSNPFLLSHGRVGPTARVHPACGGSGVMRRAGALRSSVGSPCPRVGSR